MALGLGEWVAIGVPGGGALIALARYLLTRASTASISRTRDDFHAALNALREEIDVNVTDQIERMRSAQDVAKSEILGAVKEGRAERREDLKNVQEQIGQMNSRIDRIRDGTSGHTRRN